MRFLDANVILRYLTGDDEAKAAASRALLQRAQEGTEDLFTAETTIAGIVNVLRSPRLEYRLTNKEIRDRLIPVLAISNLHLPRKTVCLRALDIFALNTVLDFEDALAIAHMEAEGIDEIVSYDRDFDRVSGVTRMEP